MSSQLESTFSKLIQRLSGLPGVQSIGRSGGRPLPASPADGDIDVFLYCDAVPSRQERAKALVELAGELDDVSVGVFSGGHWGDGDFVRIHGIETWLMYFTMAEAAAEVEDVLNGKHPDKTDGNYYPTGRCAMYLRMDLLCDRTGFLKALRNRLSMYPESLSQGITTYHMGALGDAEDLERAFARKDVLFYHFALDIALDHFLQALFAMNRVFFPSRKRSMEFIQAFSVKPENCEERLLEVLRLGGVPDGIGLSYQMWQALVQGLKELRDP